MNQTMNYSQICWEFRIFKKKNYFGTMLQRFVLVYNLKFFQYKLKLDLKYVEIL
jgi:hypothetical protein